VKCAIITGALSKKLIHLSMQDFPGGIQWRMKSQYE
jgi:hypothetical protein